MLQVLSKKDIEKRVYYVHKETKHVLDREYLKYNQDMFTYEFCVAEQPKRMDFDFDCVIPINVNRYSYKLHEIPLHDDWETVVTTNLDFNIQEYVTLVQNIPYPSVREKAKNTIDIIEAINRHNMKLPLK